VNDVQVQGAVFCLGDLFMMWNLKNWHDLTPDSLSMLQLFKPAPGDSPLHLLNSAPLPYLKQSKLAVHADLVIIGCGLHSQMVPPDLQMYFRKHRIAYEAIDTVSQLLDKNTLITICIGKDSQTAQAKCCLQANAVSTFNILNQEGRKVAGVLLPAGSN